MADKQESLCDDVDVRVTLKGVRAPLCVGAGATCVRGRDRGPLWTTAGRVPDDDAARGPVRDHGRTAEVPQLSDGRQTVGCQQHGSGDCLNNQLLFADCGDHRALIQCRGISTGGGGRGSYSPQNSGWPTTLHTLKCRGAVQCVVTLPPTP